MSKFQSETRSELLCSLRNIFMRIELLGKEMSQFTIDFQQDQLGIEELYDPNKIGSLRDGEKYLASLSYTCQKVLTIMKKDIPDRKFFESLLFLCESLKLYKFDFEGDKKPTQIEEREKKMIIKNDWEFNDLVTGLKFKVIVGEKLDRLHIENIKQGSCNNRDLWFTKDGKFDGTGSGCE